MENHSNIRVQKERKNQLDGARSNERKRKQAVRNRICQAQNNAKRLSNHGIFREYWKLGLYLIEHKRNKEVMEYLLEAIRYKEDSEHSCAYHQLGVVNKLMEKKDNLE